MIVVETLMAEDLELGIGSTSKTHQSGGVLQGHQISLSTLSLAGAAGVGTTDTWDPSNIVNGGSVSTTIAVPGAALGDQVLWSFSLDLAGLIPFAYVSAANVVTIGLANLSGAPVDLASGTAKVLVFRTR